MSQKRMFNLSVVDTDNFLQMPISSRLLYYELGMRADDDGFVDDWRKILLFTGLKEDDIKVLVAKQFIIPFESGIIVIKHWRMNNYLQKDRIKPTIYQSELKQLNIDENNVYIMDTTCIHSIDKYSIDKYSIDKDNNIYIEPKKKKTKYADYVSMYEDEYKKLVDNNGEDVINKCIEILDNYKGATGKKYKDDYRAILSWVLDKVKKESNCKQKETLNFADLGKEMEEMGC